jgi:hypothetical protein
MNAADARALGRIAGANAPPLTAAQRALIEQILRGATPPPATTPGTATTEHIRTTDAKGDPPCSVTPD